MDYETEDKAALRRSLLALRTCPQCRLDLVPVVGRAGQNLWRCVDFDNPSHDPETWQLEPINQEMS